MDATRHGMTVRTIDLDHEQMLVLEGRPGSRIRVLYGGMWLTAEGDLEDHFPRSGDEVAVRAHRRSVAESLGPTRIEIHEPIHDGVLQRVGAMVRRRLRPSSATGNVARTRWRVGSLTLRGMAGVFAAVATVGALTALAELFQVETPPVAAITLPAVVVRMDTAHTAGVPCCLAPGRDSEVPRHRDSGDCRRRAGRRVVPVAVGCRLRSGGRVLIGRRSMPMSNVRLANELPAPTVPAIGSCGLARAAWRQHNSATLKALSLEQTMKVGILGSGDVAKSLAAGFSSTVTTSCWERASPPSWSDWDGSTPDGSHRQFRRCREVRRRRRARGQGHRRRGCAARRRRTISTARRSSTRPTRSRTSRRRTVCSATSRVSTNR